MKELPFGIHTATKEACFVIPFLRAHQPWINDTTLPEGVRNTTTPVIILLERWDGRQGFIGGFKESGYSIEQTIVKECLEETNNHIEETELKPLISHKFSITTHAMSKEFNSFEELIQFTENIKNSKHYMNEILGYSVLYVGDLGRDKGLTQILKKNMATSCIEELVYLLIEEDLVDIETIKNSCIKANIDISTLHKKLQ